MVWSTTRRVLRPAALAAIALSVVSCADGDGGETTTASSTAPGEATATTFEPPALPSTSLPDGATETPATTDAVSETTEPAATSSTAVTATEPPPPPTVPADDGDCLVGAWVVTEQQMNAYYQGLMATVDAPISMTASGQAGLRFDAAGTYAWTPEFQLVVDVVGQPGTGATTGSITGSYTAADGALVTASDVNAVELSITVGGTTFSGSDLANGLLNSSPVNGVTFSCAGPTPVIDFKTADPEVTVPVTLTPA